MADESTAVANSIASRNQELISENVRRKRALRDKVQELEKALARVKELEDAAAGHGKAVEKADARIKELEQAVKDAPGKAAERVRELEQKERSRVHRAAFDRIAKDKVRDDAKARDDAYGLLKWDESSDSPDESQLREAIDRLISDRAYLKPGPDGPESSPDGNRQSNPGFRPPGPEIDRGSAPGKAEEVPNFGGRIA